jgi:hypothetical protein
MLARSPPTDHARRRACKREAQQRWRQNERAGKRLARVPVSAAILNWLERHYPGACNWDDLADVRHLIGKILEASARSELQINLRGSAPGLPLLCFSARTAILGSESRIPAPEIEQAIVSALQKYITEQNSGTSDHDDPIKFNHDGLAALVSRIEV